MPPPPDAPPLQTRIVRRKLRDLKLLSREENAHFMNAATYRLLVENLRIDGVMTSAPLVEPDGTVRSGNHRVQAAIEAGIEEADVIEIVNADELPAGRKVAIQLAHNAVNGEDDPAKAKRLFEGLDLGWKKFSGLTDNMFSGLKDLDLKGLAIGAPAYKEIAIRFLPEQAEAFLATVARAEKMAKRGGAMLVARYEDFDAFFKSIVATKRVRGIFQSAVAVKMIADLANAELEREEAKLAQERGDADDDGPSASRPLTEAPPSMTTPETPTP